MYAGHRGQHRRKLHQLREPLPWRSVVEYDNQRELAVQQVAQLMQTQPPAKPKARYALVIATLFVIVLCVLLLLLGK